VGRQAQAKRKRRRPRPVTLAEVDAFLASPVARHYFAFSESNVKRRLVRMLFYLRTEVERLQHHLPDSEAGASPWVERVTGSSRR
jgi:hypothetical protein